ncbi:hypothetical protein ACHAWF_005491 [Thalassiosira exigua]
MAMDAPKAASITEHLDEFLEACEWGISLEFVREAIASLPKVSDDEFNDAIQHCSLLGEVCANDSVTLEIVEEVLKFHPDAAKVLRVEYGNTKERGWDEIGTSYPLHAACWNERCPLSLIELLVAKHPEALCHMGILGCGLGAPAADRAGVYPVEGTPFSYYLDRKANLTLEGVNFLFEAYPSVLEMETVEFGLTKSMGRSELKGEEIGTSYPVHAACKNESCPLPVVELIMSKNHDALRHLGMCAGGLRRSSQDFSYVHAKGTPLSYYLERKANLTLDGVKLLLDAYPQAMKRKDERKRLTPLHTLALNPTLSDHFDILQYLVRKDPSLLRKVDSYNADDWDLRRCGSSPLHVLCAENGSVTLEIVKFLVENWPDSVNRKDFYDCYPLHCLCQNKKLDDSSSLDILKYLVGANTAAVHEIHSQGNLPVHFAAGTGRRGRDFCEYLVAQFPESVQATNVNQHLPLQEACKSGRLDTVKYLVEIFPEALGVLSTSGLSCSHHAISNDVDRSDIFDFLLSLDPKCLSKTVVDVNRNYHSRFIGNLPLHMMMELICPKSEECMKSLFDRYPEAILIRNNMGHSPLDLAKNKARDLAPFLEKQNEYAINAKSSDALTTPNGCGQLLLHQAIIDKGASLGTIKLLVKENQSAVGVLDNKGLLPAHLACYRRAPDILEYLLELNPSALRVCDAAGHNLLHHACQSGNCGAVKMLVEKCPSLVSEVNSRGMLPLHLLCHKSGKNYAILASVEYTEAIWRLLVAEPATAPPAADEVCTVMAKSTCGKRKRGGS